MSDLQLVDRPRPANTSRLAPRPPLRVDADARAALALLTDALRGLRQEDELTAEEVALRGAQYEASALGQYCPEVAFDPVAAALRACAARHRRGAVRWARWQAAVRAAVRPVAAPEDTIGLDALVRSCDALQVVLRANPHADAADRRTLARAQELGLVHGPRALARYHAGRFTVLTATAYPNASMAVLKIANDWHYWLFSFDDRTDVRGRDLAVDLARHERVVAAILDLLADRELPATPDADDPNVRFLARILAELRAVAPTACFDRFRGMVRDYLVRGSLTGAHNWAADHTPDPDAFLAQRIYEGAYETILPFIELAVGCAAAEGVVDSAEGRRAALLANLIVVVSNDIFSYEKEVVHAGNPNNLLHALQTHERRDLRDSFGRAVAMVEAWTAELLAIEARADGHLRAYVRGNFTWVVASCRWHFESGRYASPTSPFTELRRDPPLT